MSSTNHKLLQTQETLPTLLRCSTDLNSQTRLCSTTQALLLPVAGVLAVIAAVFAFMFMRIRGKVSYFQLVVEDQIKDLEGLTLRISKIDRKCSSNLESVKDRLKRLVGM